MTTPLHGAVVRTERIAPRIVRIVLGGDGLATFEPTGFTDQYVNVLFPPEGADYDVPFDVDAARQSEHRPVGRRYTVRAWDPGARQVVIDFVVHGDEGIAGRWANNAQVGDLLQFTVPGGGYAPDPAADWFLMAGDESALPAIAASLEQVPETKVALAAIAVDGPGHEVQLECPGDLRVSWVHRLAGGDLPATVEALEFPAGTPDVFVHGEAGETRAIRRHLIADRCLLKDAMSISPYWRRGHDDEAWRAVKRDWLAEVETDT